jgi:hypothetical protein
MLSVDNMLPRYKPFLRYCPEAETLREEQQEIEVRRRVRETLATTQTTINNNRKKSKPSAKMAGEPTLSEKTEEKTGGQKEKGKKASSTEPPEKGMIITSRFYERNVLKQIRLFPTDFF